MRKGTGMYILINKLRRYFIITILILSALFVITGCYSGGPAKQQKADTGGGDTAIWQQTSGPVGAETIYALAIATANNNIVYAGTDKSGVFKTTDGGISWTAIGLMNMKVSSLAVDPTDSQTVYAAIEWGGVYKTTNGGASWTAMNLSSTNSNVCSLAIAPSNSQIVYAGITYGGVYKTTDGGMSWSQTSMTVTPQSLVIDLTNSNIVYAGTEGTGVLKTTDGGASWTKMNNGLGCLTSSNGEQNFYVYSLAIDPTDSQSVYAVATPDTVGNYQIYKTTDGGVSWMQISNGFPKTGTCQ